MNNVFFYSLMDESKLNKLLVSITSLKATLTQASIAVILNEHYSERALRVVRMLGAAPIVVHQGVLYPHYSGTEIKDKELFGMIDCASLGYEKMIYVDTNLYFLRNVDELFDKVGGTLAYDPYNPTSDHIPLWVYTPVPYTTQDIIEKIQKNSITSVKQWINSYYFNSERPKTHLPIEYSTNIFGMIKYVDNPLFNRSNFKILDVYNEEKDILDIESLISYDYRIQQEISEYINQYNLIIGMYKQLYPDLLEGIDIKERNF